MDISPCHNGAAKNTCTGGKEIFGNPIYVFLLGTDGRTEDENTFRVANVVQVSGGVFECFGYSSWAFMLRRPLTLGPSLAVENADRKIVKMHARAQFLAKYRPSDQTTAFRQRSFEIDIVSGVCHTASF